MNPLFDEALSFVSDTVRRFYAGTGIEQVVERFSDDALVDRRGRGGILDQRRRDRVVFDEARAACASVRRFSTRSFTW